MIPLHLTLLATEAPNENLCKSSRLPHKVGVFAYKCFGFDFRTFVFVLFCLVCSFSCFFLLCAPYIILYHSIVWTTSVNDQVENKCASKSHNASRVSTNVRLLNIQRLCWEIERGGRLQGRAITWILNNEYTPPQQLLSKSVRLSWCTGFSYRRNFLTEWCGIRMKRHKTNFQNASRVGTNVHLLNIQWLCWEIERSGRLQGRAITWILDNKHTPPQQLLSRSVRAVLVLNEV